MNQLARITLDTAQRRDASGLLIVDSLTTVLPVLPGAPRKWTRSQYRKAAHDFRQEAFEEREAEERGEEFDNTGFHLSRTGARWFFLRLAVIDDNLARGQAMARCRSAIFLRNNLGRWPRRERVLKLALPGVQS